VAPPGWPALLVLLLLLLLLLLLGASPCPFALIVPGTPCFCRMVNSWRGSTVRTFQRSRAASWPRHRAIRD